MTQINIFMKQKQTHDMEDRLAVAEGRQGRQGRAG